MNINERGINKCGFLFHRSTRKRNGERNDRTVVAYVRAVLLNGGELMFCAHHGKEYAEKLKPIAAKIQDESEKLIESSN
jgi:hypothetical protein